MAGELLQLTNGAHAAVLRVGVGFPELVHLGPSVSGNFDPALFDATVPPGGLDSPGRPTLVADPGRGWFGEPGIILTRGGTALSPAFEETARSAVPGHASFTYAGAGDDVTLAITVTLESSGVLVLSASVTNTGPRELGVAALALSVPVPGRLDSLLTFGGRHAMEFCEERTDWKRSVVSVSSRRGRTSHQQAPTVFCTARTTGENSGDAWAVHLACSGNHRLVCDSVNADRRTVTAGEILAPGEIVLSPGGTYSTPDVLVSASSTGLNGASTAFHRHIRAHSPAVTGPRPVIVNTWEAVYFDHDAERLFELARRAARVGAERFVLDDGWFMGRRDDTAGLGDWEIDPTVWPDGLAPLAGHVTSLGMDFGIWVEPEMVNPESALYRTHPEWVLGAPHQHALTGRNQLVLDLSRTDVRDHLFTRLDALLSGLPVAHVKWDHNRDAVAHGAHHQAAGLADLLGRLRERHPEVHFESCASGGGRIDAAIARNVSRFWTSDSIDALDRLSIQRGASRIIPPEMLGAHIGAPFCHTTGRRHPLSFRALSAMPFWLGIEWDLLSADEKELTRLADVVAIHKAHRDLFHTGTTHFGDHPDPQVHVHAVVAGGRDRAMVVVASLGSGPRHVTAPVCIPGLEPGADYRCTVLPTGDPRWALHRGLPSWVEDGVTATGSQLATVGLPWPPLLPASGILVHVERVS